MHGANRIGQVIDRKFMISEVSTEGGDRTRYDENHGVLFLAKDNAFPAALRFYRQECARLGAAAEQLLGIDLLIERVDFYQAANPDICKVPDVDGARGAHIIAPNHSYDIAFPNRRTQ